MKERQRWVRPLRSGQITIPAEFRQELEIDEHTLLRVSLVGGELRIRPVKVDDAAKGAPWAKELYELFTEVRREAGRYSEAEVNRDIDRAVAATRRKRRARRS